MPKIYLKPNSAEFLDEDSKDPKIQCCDMPGCREEGTYKAPKDRELSDYYWFCLEHVQEYNKAWDFFSGMSHSQMEDKIFNANIWDRPTWKFSSYANLEAELRRKAQRFSNFGEEQTKQQQQEFKDKTNSNARYIDKHTPEFEAMAIMGLEPPLELASIKARYKVLVKKHHPDLNQGDQKSEELLKSINMAYTILKLAYEKYEKLTDEKK